MQSVSFRHHQRNSDVGIGSTHNFMPPHRVVYSPIRSRSRSPGQESKCHQQPVRASARKSLRPNVSDKNAVPRMSNGYPNEIIVIDQVPNRRDPRGDHLHSARSAYLQGSPQASPLSTDMFASRIPVPHHPYGLPRNSDCFRPRDTTIPVRHQRESFPLPHRQPRRDSLPVNMKGRDSLTQPLGKESYVQVPVRESLTQMQKSQRDLPQIEHRDCRAQNRERVPNSKPSSHSYYARSRDRPATAAPGCFPTPRDHGMPMMHHSSNDLGGSRGSLIPVPEGDSLSGAPLREHQIHRSQAAYQGYQDGTMKGVLPKHPSRTKYSKYETSTGHRSPQPFSNREAALRSPLISGTRGYGTNSKQSTDHLQGSAKGFARDQTREADRGNDHSRTPHKNRQKKHVEFRDISDMQPNHPPVSLAQSKGTDGNRPQQIWRQLGTCPPCVQTGKEKKYSKLPDQHIYVQEKSKIATIAEKEQIAKPKKEPKTEKKKKDTNKDKIVHFDWTEGMLLNNKYKVMKLLGDGTFGRVLQVADVKTKAILAVKVVRDVQRYTEAAEIEADILRDIHTQDVHKVSGCAHMYDTFMHFNHYCMVFEPLGSNLYEYLKLNNYKGFHIADIQTIATHLVSSLGYLHSIKLTHTDLKPENLLLKSNSSYSHNFSRGSGIVKRPRSAQIKLIDFGGATFEHDHHSSVINTRQYRCPEVILGITWTMSSDWWSVGCILMELYTGEMLFPTHDNLEHLAMMKQVTGQDCPLNMVHSSNKAAQKYFREKDGMLDWPASASSSTSVRNVERCKRLHKYVRPEHSALADMVSELLVWEPSKRPLAQQILQHPFFRTKYPDSK